MTFLIIPEPNHGKQRFVYVENKVLFRPRFGFWCAQDLGSREYGMVSRSGDRATSTVARPIGTVVSDPGGWEGKEKIESSIIFPDPRPTPPTPFFYPKNPPSPSPQKATTILLDPLNSPFTTTLPTATLYMSHYILLGLMDKTLALSCLINPRLALEDLRPPRLFFTSLKH